MYINSKQKISLLQTLHISLAHNKTWDTVFFCCVLRLPSPFYFLIHLGPCGSFFFTKYCWYLMWCIWTKGVFLLSLSNVSCSSEQMKKHIIEHIERRWCWRTPEQQPSIRPPSSSNRGRLLFPMLALLASSLNHTLCPVQPGYWWMNQSLIRMWSSNFFFSTTRHHDIFRPTDRLNFDTTFPFPFFSHHFFLFLFFFLMKWACLCFCVVFFFPCFLLAFFLASWVLNLE